MPFDQLVRNDQIVQSLSQTLATAEGALKHVNGLLEIVLDKEMWRERTITAHDIDRRVHFERLENFVKAHPLEGLGMTMDRLEKLCKAAEVAGFGLSPLAETPDESDPD